MSNATDEVPPEAAAEEDRTMEPDARPARAKKPKAEKSAPPTIPEHLQGLTVGRTVHFVVPDLVGGRQAMHRPAIVTFVEDNGTGDCSLTVFIRKDDYPKNNHPGSVLLLTGVPFGKADEPSTWHWPERA